MRLVNSCILELREYKGRRIVCQLKLDGDAVGKASIEEPQDFHWLEKQHWENFDAQLEQLIDNISDKTRIRNKTVEKTFRLHDEVDVQVRNSAASLKTLLDCLGHLTLDRNDNTLALDFLVRRRRKRIHDEKDTDILGLDDFPCGADELEYHPLPVSNVPVSPEASCLPYVPTKIGIKNFNLTHTTDSNICDVDDEDRYSPELPKECTLPVYTPKPIGKEIDIFANSSKDDDAILSARKLRKSTIPCIAEDEKTSKLRLTEEQPDSSPDILIQSEKGEINIGTRQKNHKHADQIKNSHVQRKDEKPTNSHLPKGQDECHGETLYEKEESQDDIDLEKYVKSIKNVTGKNLDGKGKQKTARIESKSDENASAMRRSNRSPVKTSRYKVEDVRPFNSTNKSKKRSQTVSKTMQECFGSDAESDDFTEKTPIKAAPKIHVGSAQLTSSVKKRKREEKNERSCEQEKQSLSKWLSKKKPTELIKSPKKTSKSSKSRVKETKANEADSSCGIISRIVYPTPEEIANNERREKEQMKVNRKMKILLEDLIQAPKKVEILSLNNMSADEILNTFPKYKEHLDSIFNTLRTKPKVNGYNGINHYSVIDLIDNEKQLKIMNKLGEVYENESEGTSMYSSLFANALMPEWLVNIFKDKHKFSYHEAVSRLQDQQQYIQYMDLEDHH